MRLGYRDAFASLHLAADAVHHAVLREVGFTLAGQCVHGLCVDELAHGVLSQVVHAAVWVRDGRHMRDGRFIRDDHRAVCVHNPRESDEHESCVVPLSVL
eukprot:1244494-Pyramimonas_sp.AAC.1